MLESANKAITHNFSQQEKELARQTELQYDTVIIIILIRFIRNTFLIFQSPLFRDPSVF